MKTKNLLYLIPLVSVLIGCKGKSKISADDKNARTISIEYQEQYCGGAQPNDEVMEDINELKLFANQSAYISKFVNPKTFTDEIKVNCF